MIRVNIHEAKAQLSRLLVRALAGDRVVLCRRNVPIAEVVPLPPERNRPRPVGRASVGFAVPPAFFEPLPGDVVTDLAGPRP